VKRLTYIFRLALELDLGRGIFLTWGMDREPWRAEDQGRFMRGSRVQERSILRLDERAREAGAA